jgi:hypothetical protein
VRRLHAPPASPALRLGGGVTPLDKLTKNPELDGLDYGAKYIKRI